MSKRKTKPVATAPKPNVVPPFAAKEVTHFVDLGWDLISNTCVKPASGLKVAVNLKTSPKQPSMQT